MKEEIQRAKDAMYQQFTIGRQNPIYDPTQFWIFLNSAGGTLLLKTILTSVTSSDTQANDKKLTRKEWLQSYTNFATALANNVTICKWSFFVSHINQEGID